MVSPRSEERGFFWLHCQHGLGSPTCAAIDAFLNGSIVWWYGVLKAIRKMLCKGYAIAGVHKPRDRFRLRHWPQPCTTATLSIVGIGVFAAGAACTVDKQRPLWGAIQVFRAIVEM